MASAAYVIGALDALVKSGEVSPEYAAGVVSVLEKDADIAYLVDDPRKNYREQIETFMKQNPGAYSGGRLNISPEQAADVIDRSRHFWDNGFENARIWAGNRARKLFRWWPTNKMTPAMYDRELEDSYNMARKAYIERELSGPGGRIDHEVAAAVQDKHVNDANMRIKDLDRLEVPENKRRGMGYGKGYAQSFRTQAGDAAIAGGYYKPVYDKQNKPPEQPTAYGANIPDAYGAQKGLYYASPYKHF